MCVKVCIIMQPLVDDLIRDPRNGTLDPLWRELEQLRELKERVYGRVRTNSTLMLKFVMGRIYGWIGVQ